MKWFNLSRVSFQLLVESSEKSLACSGDKREVMACLDLSFLIFLKLSFVVALRFCTRVDMSNFDDECLFLRLLPFARFLDILCLRRESAEDSLEEEFRLLSLLLLSLLLLSLGSPRDRRRVGLPRCLFRWLPRSWPLIRGRSRRSS